MTDPIRKALAMGLCAAALAACTKEATAPSSMAASVEHPGHTKADPVEPGTYRYYAIYRMDGGTGLALFNPDERRMVPLGPIVDGETGHPVDHFTGMTYLSVDRSTLLVTNSAETHEEEQQNWLWRIEQALPTEPVDRIKAFKVHTLWVRTTDVPSVVKDARDIEHYGEDKIAMLRSGPDGNNASVYWLNPGGEASEAFHVENTGAQALTADQATRHVYVLCASKETSPPVLFTYTPFEEWPHGHYFGFAGFSVTDVGIEILRDRDRDEQPEIVGVNMQPEPVMVTSSDNDPHYEETHVLPTIDLTRVPIE